MSLRRPAYDGSGREDNNTIWERRCYIICSTYLSSALLFLTTVAYRSHNSFLSQYKMLPTTTAPVPPLTEDVTSTMAPFATSPTQTPLPGENKNIYEHSNHNLPLAFVYVNTMTYYFFNPTRLAVYVKIS